MARANASDAISLFTSKMDELIEAVGEVKGALEYEEATKESFSVVGVKIADGAAVTVVELMPAVGEVWKIKGIGASADGVARDVILTMGDGRPIANISTLASTGQGSTAPPDFVLPDGARIVARFPAAVPAGTSAVLHVWGSREIKGD